MNRHLSYRICHHWLSGEGDKHLSFDVSTPRVDAIWSLFGEIHEFILPQIMGGSPLQERLGKTLCLLLVGEVPKRSSLTRNDIRLLREALKLFDDISWGERGLSPADLQDVRPETQQTGRKIILDERSPERVAALCAA